MSTSPPHTPPHQRPARGPQRDAAEEPSARGGAASERGFAAAGPAVGMRRDYTRPGRWWSGWGLPLLLGSAAFAVLLPFDGPLFANAARLGQSLGGDARREWTAWQQYGQGVSLIVIALLILLLDPGRRRRLWDLLLAVILAQVASTAGKMLIGRPRPRPEFMDPTSFPGPWGVYPIRRDGQWTLVHAWDKRAGAGADLWSMPSSHTLFAFMLSAFLSALYPRAAWLFWFLAAMVALGRIVFGAHWPTDVVVGGALGYAIGAAVTRRGLGGRLAARARPARPHHPAPAA